MDVMQLRRNLLMGVSAMIGDFSKYERKTLTFPNTSNGSSWDNCAIIPCSFEPKFVVFYGGTEQTGIIVKGMLAFTIATNLDYGLIKAVNTSGVLSNYSYTKNDVIGVSRFKYDNGALYISHISYSILWSKTDSYTFEIYG